MAEVAVSPKKVPIEDWVKAVKKLEPSGLKGEEKKVFDMVKVHHNIPKSASKFSNFCIHNLKVKDEKMINRIWGHLSVALGEQKSKVVGKETKETKKEKIEQKLKPKKAVNGKPAQKSDNDAGSDGESPAKAKPANAKQADNKQANAKQADNKQANQKQANNKQANNKQANNKQANDKQAANNKNKQSPVEEVKGAKKAKIEQKTKAGKKEEATNAAANKNNKQEPKKKVSFSKNGTPPDNKAQKGGDSLTKAHKQTPKKVADPKGTQLEVKKKVDTGNKKVVEVKGAAKKGAQPQKQQPGKKGAAAKVDPKKKQKDEDDDDEDDDDLDDSELDDEEDSDDLDDSDEDGISFDEDDDEELDSDDLDDDDDDDDEDDDDDDE